MNRRLPIGENLNRGVSRRNTRRRTECGCTYLCAPPREPPCSSAVNLSRFIFTERSKMEPVASHEPWKTKVR